MISNENNIHIWLREKDTFFEKKSDDSLNKYEVNELLGEGCTGNVYSLKSNSNNRKVIKTSTKYILYNEFNMTRLYPYGSTGLQLKADAYFPARNGKPETIIMPEYHGTLDEYIENFDNADKIKAIYQLSIGLQTLHKEGIINLDLKLENTFIEKELNRVDIGDFGGTIFIDLIDNKEYGFSDEKEKDEFIKYYYQKDIKKFKDLVFKILFYKKKQKRYKKNKKQFNRRTYK